MDKKTGSRYSNKRKNTKLKKILLILFIVILTISIYKIFLGYDRLKGVWSIDGVTKYEFDGNGYGKMILPSIEYDFQYKIEDNKISIDFKDETLKDATYTYNIKKKSMNFIGDSEGALDFEFKKEK